MNFIIRSLSIFFLIIIISAVFVSGALYFEDRLEVKTKKKLSEILEEENFLVEWSNPDLNFNKDLLRSIEDFLQSDELDASVRYVLKINKTRLLKCIDIQSR